MHKSIPPPHTFASLVYSRGRRGFVSLASSLAGSIHTMVTLLLIKLCSCTFYIATDILKSVRNEGKHEDRHSVTLKTVAG